MKKKQKFIPKTIFTKAFPYISDNTVNGLGESKVRKASPFFGIRQHGKHMGHYILLYWNIISSRRV